MSERASVYPAIDSEHHEAAAATDTREQLAAYAHEAWSGWMEYMFGKCRLYGDTTRGIELIIPGDLVARWKRQMTTAYADLPEHEKDSDRDEADRMLAIVGATVDRAAVGES